MADKTYTYGKAEAKERHTDVRGKETQDKDKARKDEVQDRISKNTYVFGLKKEDG
ncbi:hypothetical protein KBY25_21840 [Ruegeria pomeroyi]|nr:hypothetical protein [Ruegeria pomeroyi]